MSKLYLNQRLLWRVTTLICLLFTLCNPLFAKQGSNMTNSISYTSTVSDEHFATKLLITPDGLGKLTLGSNRNQREKAIGVFQQVIPGNILQAITTTVGSSEFANSPQQLQLIPGETFREIALKSPDQKSISKIIGEDVQTPAVFAKAEQSIQAAIDYLEHSPVLGLAMRVGPFPAQVPIGSSMWVDITVYNQGRTPVFIQSPKTWGKNSSQCELKAVRSDIPLAELGSQHQFFGQLDGEHFIQSLPEFTAPALGLMPGEQLSMRFQTTLTGQAGHYQVEISLALNTFDQDGKPLFSGDLVSTPQVLEFLAPQPK